MTKGSKCLHVHNKYRTLSWLLTVAGRLVVHTSPAPRLASEDRCNPFKGGVLGKPPAMTSSHHPWGTYCRECSYGGVMRRYQFICRSSGISYNDPSAGVEIVCFAAAIAEQILHFKADPACPGHLPASHSNLTLAIGKQLSLHSKLTK